MDFPRVIMNLMRTDAAHAGLVAMPFHMPDEGMLTRRGPVSLLKAEESKVFETAHHEMLGCHDADGLVIDVHERKPGVRHHAKHIHHRKAGAAKRSSHCWSEYAGNDAVAFPSLQPRRQFLVDASSLVKQQPGLVLTDVAGDAGENVTSAAKRCLNHQGNVRWL